jgi:hypothetical protein
MAGQAVVVPTETTYGRDSRTHASGPALIWARTKRYRHVFYDKSTADVTGSWVNDMPASDARPRQPVWLARAGWL